MNRVVVEVYVVIGTGFNRGTLKLTFQRGDLF